MSHGVGAVEFAAALPDAVVVVFVVLTLLGEPELLLVGLLALYLWGEHLPVAGPGFDRSRAAVLVALALGAFALSAGLKALVAHPRPPAAAIVVGADLVPAPLRGLYAQAATSDGFAIPSGHALGSTVVYGGWALWGEVPSDRRRRRLAAAAVLVAVVATSRVVIGVHYLGDVVAGVVVGAGFLAVVRLYAPAAPGRALLLSLTVALAAVAVAGYAVTPLSILGAVLGARIAWGGVGDAIPDRPASERDAMRLGGVGLAVGVGLLALAVVVAPQVGEFAAPAVAFLASALGVGAVVVAPAVAGDRPRSPS